MASTGGLALALSGTDDKNKEPFFKPEYIVPIVLLLASDVLNGKKNEITGGLFECGCGWQAATRLRPSHVLRYTSASSLSPESISRLWGDSTIANTDDDVFQLIAKRKGSDKWRTNYEFSDRDVILYSKLTLALSISNSDSLS